MNRYDKACEYIENIPKFGSYAGLDNTEQTLSALLHPEKKYKSVHIAGTNGKGSVAVMISNLLREAGYRVGLFISPHLTVINERISVNGENISDDDFASEFEKIKAVSDSQGIYLTYFEFLFCMAADYFAGEKCDYVVFETGLGGRLDATNTVTPVLSVITSIGFDHMQILGNTIEEIAAEKAGIIKPGVPVVYQTGNEKADEVITKTALEKGSRALPVRTAFGDLPDFAKEAVDDFAASQSALYQKDNAITAVVSFFEILNGRTDEEYQRWTRDALTEFYWPGRMEFLSDGIVIDGAHNENAVRRFVQSANALLDGGKWKKIRLLFAVCADKDYEDIVRILSEGISFEKVYVAELASERKTKANDIGSLFRRFRMEAGAGGPSYSGEGIVSFASVPLAWNAAVSEKTEDTLLAVVGSLYLVGEIRDLLNEER